MASSGVRLVIKPACCPGVPGAQGCLRELDLSVHPAVVRQEEEPTDVEAAGPANVHSSVQCSPMTGTAPCSLGAKENCSLHQEDLQHPLLLHDSEASL